MTEKEKRTLKDGVKNLIGKYKALEHGIIEVLENNILSFIDSMQKEPVAPKVLEDTLNAKTAAESLGISAEEHDRIVDALIYGKEPELVDADDLPNEEPVSEQKLSNVGRTVKDRKEKSVSDIDFEQELYKAFGHVKDFTLGMRIAKWSYDMGKNSQEPVSEDLEKAAVEAFKQIVGSDKNNFLEIFKAGAKWQREQMMKDVIERSRKAICKSRTFPISFNLLLARILDYVIYNKPLK